MCSNLFWRVLRSAALFGDHVREFSQATWPTCLVLGQQVCDQSKRDLCANKRRFFADGTDSAIGDMIHWFDGLFSSFFRMCSYSNPTTWQDSNWSLVREIKGLIPRLTKGLTPALSDNDRQTDYKWSFTSRLIQIWYCHVILLIYEQLMSKMGCSCLLPFQDTWIYLDVSIKYNNKPLKP